MRSRWYGWAGARSLASTGSLAEGLRADQLSRGPTVDLQPSLRAAGRAGTFVSDDPSSTADSSVRDGAAGADPGSFTYVEDFVRYQLSASSVALEDGGVGAAVHSVHRCVADHRELYPALIAAVGTAFIAALVR